jgi:hypothetical protein
MSERKAVKFYRSYWEVAMELNDKDRLAFYDALMMRQFTGAEPELTGMAKFAYISQKHSIDAQVKGFEDKTKIPLQGPMQGGSKGGSKGPSVQVKEKVKEYNIEERKQQFAASLKPYLETYGKKMLNDFYLYWTEHGPTDRKLRFEKEKAFGIERRLINWDKNKDKFGNFSDDTEPKELQILKRYAKK